MYGWSVEAMGHSLNDSQVKSIQDLMESNGYGELWEVRNDLEEVGVIDDIYSPDLFHESRGLANDALWFVVSDENNKEVLKFIAKDMALVIALRSIIYLQRLTKEKEGSLVLKHLNPILCQNPLISVIKR
jgi:hypothetical protein